MLFAPSFVTTSLDAAELKCSNTQKFVKFVQSTSGSHDLILKTVHGRSFDCPGTNLAVCLLANMNLKCLV